ncbi:MAG TPA: TMEM175 family protein [Rudaea sp.]
MPRDFDHVLRVRRHQPTRLEGFVDASFAFAVTLLVISIGHVPVSVPEMLQALRGVPTFAVCFALIARLWGAHRSWSRHYDIEDAATIRLSLMLVFLVLIYVYPLRLLMSIMFAGLSNGALMEQHVVLDTVADLRAAYAVFGIGYAAIGFVFVRLLQHALARREAIGLDAAEIVVTRFNQLRWICVVVVALLSVLLAAVLPFENGTPWIYSLPGCVYWLLFVSFAILRRRCTARLAAMHATVAPA